MSINKKIVISVVAVVVVALVLVTSLANNLVPSSKKELVHDKKWGLYVLDLGTQETGILYSSETKISRIRLSTDGNQLVFSKQIGNSSEVVEGSPVNVFEEICSIGVDGEGFRRITDNNVWDLIPNWSVDDSRIFFLSFRETLDVFVMDFDGGNRALVYDSGFHDSDLHCSSGKLVFTRNSQIWMMNEDGTGLTQVTDPPRAGEWGSAVLPFGDYDPNLSPDGKKIVFERLVDDETSHGNYNLYVVNVDGSEEHAVTDTGYSQGLPVWSHSGEQFVYLVGAIGNEADYRIYLMNSDGSNNHKITPDHFPAEFLCQDAIFSMDDSKIFFIGEWYSD